LEELTSQPKKYSNGSMLMEFTGLSMCSTILKQLAERVEWSFEDPVTETAR
jgi:hypothetical protein